MTKSGKCSGLSSLITVLLHTKDRVIERIADFFAWWAALVYDFPYRFIIGTFVFVLLACIGEFVEAIFGAMYVLSFQGFIPGIPVWIDGAEALYSLPYSTARSQGAVHKVLFNETSTRPSFVLITGQNPGENIFTWEHLEAVRQLDRLIRGQTVDPKYGRRIGIARRDEYGMNVDGESAKKPRPDIPSNGTLGSLLPIDESVPEEALEMINLLNNALSKRLKPEDDRGDAGLDILTFQDICARNPFGDCTVSGVQEMGVFDIKDTLLKPGDPPMLFLFEGLAFNAKKKAFPPHYLLGKATEAPCSPELPTAMLSLFYKEDELMPGSKRGMARANMTCITKAEAFQLIYEISDKVGYKKRNEDWEKVFVDVVADNRDFGPLKITMNAFRSRDDALRASTSESSDVLFVALTFALLVAYSSSLNFSCDLFRSKSYPALAGVVAAILGMIAGMGIMSLCGIAFVPTALVCPFLVVGVGVDDMFVIINAYSLAYMIDSSRDRCILSLKDTGLAITLTTTTSLVSFIIGLNTGYLSIKNFCWFCGSGMFFGYIFVLTFFFAIHCLDAKREEENMVCLFCVPNNERRESRREQLRKEGVQFSKEADITTFTLGALMVRRSEQDALRRHALRLRRKHIAAAATNEKDIERGGKKAYSDSQDTQETLTPETEAVYPVTKNQKSSRKSDWLRSTFVYRGMVALYDLANSMSDELLTRVALEAHYIGKERGLDPDPSNGVLEFPNDKECPSTGDPLVDIVNHPVIPLYYNSIITGEKKLFINEPRGAVGVKWRKFLICYYGPLLVNPISKAVAFLLFGLFLAVSLYGCTQLESGLDLKDLAPAGSYLNDYDATQESYFTDYDFPVDIFFPDFQDWWAPEVQQAMRDMESAMKTSGSGKLVTNPVVRMLEDPELSRGLKSGNKEIFERTLYNALKLENGKYRQFEQNFVWEGNRLRAWKMQILPGVMKTSSERAAWMTQIRKDCEDQLKLPQPMVVMAYNYMMTFYESDLQINSSVTSNMIVAAITMLIVAMIGIPQLLAGVIVILIMGMIDVGIIGFMYFWGVKLNMVSMICLLISVGFSVDFSAHVCHTFMDAEGQTRNQRAIESLVLMGNPVFHGATSSILGVLMLAFSTSFIFRVFLKMMTMVTVFALAHSVVFLPVLLSVVGDARPHKQPKVTIEAKIEVKATAPTALEPRKKREPSPKSTPGSGAPIKSPSRRRDSRRSRRRPETSPVEISAVHLKGRAQSIRPSRSPTWSGSRGRTVASSPISRNGHYRPFELVSQPVLSRSYHSEYGNTPGEWRKQRSMERESSRRRHRIPPHRILVIEENRATDYPDECFDQGPRYDDYYRPRTGRARSRRSVASIRDWKSPRFQPSQNGEWFDEDYRVELAPMSTRESHSGRRPSPTSSELISPERERRSPVTRRKQRREITTAG